jgi:hypothetical protein
LRDCYGFLKRQTSGHFSRTAEKIIVSNYLYFLTADYAESDSPQVLMGFIQANSIKGFTLTMLSEPAMMDAAWNLLVGQVGGAGSEFCFAVWHWL